MLDEVLKMRSLLNEIEEPLEEFNDKLFHELVKGIEINKQYVMNTRTKRPGPLCGARASWCRWCQSRAGRPQAGSGDGGAAAQSPQGIRVRPTRQKNSAPFRFRGLRKSRGNCTSAESFFLSKPEDSRGSSDLVCGEKMTDTL